MLDADRLLDFHEICQLKYRYIRALDTHDWPLLESCFTEDVVLWPNGGDYVARGRTDVMAMVKAIIIDSFYSSHLVVHPEIEFVGSNRARGIWRLQDALFFTAPHPFITHTPINGGEYTVGAGYYHDEYEKTDGVWRIAGCGFIRIFEMLNRPGVVDAELTIDKRFGLNGGSTEPPAPSTAL